MAASRQKISTEIRRDQIAQAALKIIGEKGARGLTTAAIAQEVGMSEANIYRHFQDKDEILAKVVERIREGLSANLEAALATKGKDAPFQRLKRIFQSHLEYIERNEGIPRLVFSEEVHGGNPLLKKRLLDSIAAYLKGIAGIIEEGQEAGVIKKESAAGPLALMFIGMLQVAILRWSLGGFAPPLVAEGMKLWESFERCLREK